MAGNGKRGRPAWIPTEADLNLAESLAAQGLDVQDIAGHFALRPETLYRKQKEYPQLDQAIKRGQIKGRAKMTNALFQQGIDGSVPAAIFWLKNRAGWKDKVEAEHSGTINHNVSRAMTDDELEAIARGEA